MMLPADIRGEGGGAVEGSEVPEEVQEEHPPVRLRTRAHDLLRPQSWPRQAPILHSHTAQVRTSQETWGDTVHVG